VKRVWRTVGEKQVDERELFVVREAEIFRLRSLNGNIIDYPPFAAGRTEAIYQYLTTMKGNTLREAH